MESTKERINTYIDVKLLAHADDEDHTEWVSIKKIQFPWDSYFFDTKTFYTVTHCQMDCEWTNYEKHYSEFKDAYAVFSEELNRTFRYGGDTEDRKVYTEVDTTLEYREAVEELEYEDDEPYTRSSTGGDYGPSNPWDAPGMKVSDFLPGVY